MQELDTKKRKLIEFLAEKNILLSPELLNELNSESDSSNLSELINKKLNETTQPKKEKTRTPGIVNIVFSYTGPPKKSTAQDFINHFNSRYTLLKKLLQNRAQLENIVSISRLKTKSEKENVAIIGMVYSKEDTKNGIMLTVEDPTGSTKVFFGKTKPGIFMKAKDIVLDEVLGITGVSGKGIIFGNGIFSPDIPLTKEIKKSPEEEIALFMSDLHVGSRYFLEDEFLKFISWINGDLGNEKQKEISSKVKYIFLTGDTIDGISIYPTQKEELTILTFKEQYKKLAYYLKMIPEDIKLILCPGQHDVVPIAEPQIPLPKEYCGELYEMPNLIFVSNPAMVNIGSNEEFPGFDVLLYHGGSYNYYADKVESIRMQQPNLSDRSENVMKFLLQKRHLSPTYDGYPRLATETDHMIIDKIPDIFISGDVHKHSTFSYKNVITGIVSSCFQSKTSFQEKVGHVPEPGIIPLLNLKTREVKLLNFGGTQEK
ncbi:MAG: metallophosphoesterase [Nanoarchaeota archaeon]